MVKGLQLNYGKSETGEGGSNMLMDSSATELAGAGL